MQVDCGDDVEDNLGKRCSRRKRSEDSEEDGVEGLDLGSETSQVGSLYEGVDGTEVSSEVTVSGVVFN